MGLKWLWFCLVTAAAFFVTYDCTKSLLSTGGELAAPHAAPVRHMLAASLGEIVSLALPHSHFFQLSLGFVLLFYQHTFHDVMFLCVGPNYSQSFHL